MPRRPSAGGEQQYPARDLTTESIDAAFERGRGEPDVAEHGRQTSHRTGSPGSRHREMGLSTHQQRPAERLVAVALVHRHGFAGEGGLVDHHAAGVDEHAVCGNPVARFETRDVSRDERLRRHVNEMAVPQHPRSCAGQCFQSTQRHFGSPLLIQPQRRVEQQDETDGRSFDGPAVQTLVEPQAQVERESEEQDVDERAGELPCEAPPQRIWRAFGQGIRTESGETVGGFGVGESAHLLIGVIHHGQVEQLECPCVRVRNGRHAGVTGVRLRTIPRTPGRFTQMTRGPEPQRLFGLMVRSVLPGMAKKVVYMLKTLGFDVELPVPFEAAVSQVKDVLKQEGFGVLSEIDLRAAFREKLGREFRPYVILGACNPTLAFTAITADPEIGLLLPCNVVVESRGAGRTLIRLTNPEVLLGTAALGEVSELATVARDARDRMVRVAATLDRASLAVKQPYASLPQDLVAGRKP